MSQCRDVFARAGRLQLVSDVCGNTFRGRSSTALNLADFRYGLLYYLFHRGMVRYDINPKLMNTDMVTSVCPARPIDQQRGIADFLDRETAG